MWPDTCAQRQQHTFVSIIVVQVIHSVYFEFKTTDSSVENLESVCVLSDLTASFAYWEITGGPREVRHLALGGVAQVQHVQHGR